MCFGSRFKTTVLNPPDVEIIHIMLRGGISHKNKNFSRMFRTLSSYLHFAKQIFNFHKNNNDSFFISNNISPKRDLVRVDQRMSLFKMFMWCLTDKLPMVCCTLLW